MQGRILAVGAVAHDELLRLAQAEDRKAVNNGVRFARYRHSVEKPATAVGFGMTSEIRYLHDNPEIDALLLRKDNHPLSEATILHVLDLALSGQPSAAGLEGSRLAESYILTGVEPFGIREIMKQGYDTSNGTLIDPRAIHLAASLDDESNKTTSVSILLVVS